MFKDKTTIMSKGLISPCLKIVSSGLLNELEVTNVTGFTSTFPMLNMLHVKMIPENGIFRSVLVKDFILTVDIMVIWYLIYNVIPCLKIVSRESEHAPTLMVG
jgi:hypothetical protein